MQYLQGKQLQLQRHMKK